MSALPDLTPHCDVCGREDPQDCIWLKCRGHCQHWDAANNPPLANVVTPGLHLHSPEEPCGPSCSLPIEEEDPTSLDLRDMLDDIVHGLRMWKDRKVRRGGIDDDDESLLRWIEAGPAQDLF